MLKMRQGRTITARAISAVTEAGKVRVGLTAVAVASTFAVGAYVFRMRLLSVPSASPIPTQDDGEAQILRRADGAGSSLLGDAPLIGALRDGDDARAAAPPPLIFMVGRPDVDGAPDLSTPAQAVHSVLALLDRGRMQALSQCFGDEAPEASEGLYPRRLGPPVELVDVVEDGDAATVVWSAAVHTEFTLDGRSRSPGETVTLTTRLVRIEGLWKLVELHDGGEEHEASAK